MHYQWQFNGSNIPEATSSVFAIPAAGVYDQGEYTVSITNIFGSTLSVSATLAINHPPVAETAPFTRGRDISLKIYIPSLLEAHTSDLDGDARTLDTVGAASSGSVLVSGSYILYLPSANADDSISYTISDGRGGTAMGTISIVVVPTSGVIQEMIPGPVGVSLRFAGIPGYAYEIQRATNPEGPWTSIHSTNAPPAGVFTFLDPNPPQPSGFYRLRSP